MPLRRYKIVAGKHTERSPLRVYKPGEIIESERRLDEIFKNKFQLIDLQDEEPDAALGTKPDVIGLELVRRGSRYHVMRSDTGEFITDKTLTKTQAQALINEWDPDADEDVDESEEEGEEETEPPPKETTRTRRRRT